MALTDDGHTPRSLWAQPMPNLWKAVRDGRGVTYVHPIAGGRTVKVPYEGLPATHVCRWFNHTTKDWVVSYSNASGHQIGDSVYCGWATWALEVAEDFIAAPDRTHWDGCTGYGPHCDCAV